MGTTGHPPLSSLIPSISAHIDAVEWAESSKRGARLVARPAADSEFHTCECVPKLDPDSGNLTCCADLTCQNRACQEECIPENCRNGSLCMNRRIGNKQWREVILFYKEGKRMGLRTVGSVIKGEFVIEYVGEAIDQAKIPKNDLRCRDRSRWSYVMILEKGICIDAGKKGGLARYINHSCDPNCSVDRWIVRGVPRLAIFARRDIVAGEELSYDYKWERDEEQDPTPCLCVSPLCRGTLEVALKTSRRTPSPRQEILGEEIFQPDEEEDEAKENLQSQCQMRAVFYNDKTMEANDYEKEEIKFLQEQNVVELKQDASSGAPTTSALLKKLNTYENMSRRNNKKGKTDYTTAWEKKRWEAKFKMLQTFKKETGQCHVPKRYPQNTSLSLWARQQRRAYKLFQEGKASSLCATKLRKLEDVGFIFDGSKYRSKTIRLAELSNITDDKRWEYF